jgi:hypothetical protein
VFPDMGEVFGFAGNRLRRFIRITSQVTHPASGGAESEHSVGTLLLMVAPLLSAALWATGFSFGNLVRLLLNGGSLVLSERSVSGTRWAGGDITSSSVCVAFRASHAKRERAAARGAE